MVNITDTDRIVALFIGAVATGMYLCTFFYCVRWLVCTDEGWKFRTRINLTMLSATLAVFFLSSTHIVLALTTTLGHIENFENGITTTSVKLPWESVVMCTVTNITVITVDGFLIYRCWVVSSRLYRRIILPLIFWIGGVVCIVLQIYWQVVQSAEISNVWTPVNMVVGPGTILTPFWGCTIVVNIYATSVIVHRIWTNAHKQVGNIISTSARELRFVKRVMIESGALYLLVTVPHFIVWFTTSSSAILIFGWINLPVVGTAFNLILIRTSQRRVSTKKQIEKAPGLVSTIQFESRTTKFSHINPTADESSSITASVRSDVLEV